MLIVTAVYWVSEAVPLGAAALVPAFLYPFFGVLRSNEVGPFVIQPSAWLGLQQMGDSQTTWWEGLFHQLEQPLILGFIPLFQILTSSSAHNLHLLQTAQNLPLSGSFP